MRYIGYPHDGRTMAAGADPQCYDSLAEARRGFAEHTRKSWVSDDAYMDLYAFRDGRQFNEAWAEAERFADTGCPFDCMDYRLSMGPRGGVVSERG